MAKKRMTFQQKLDRDSKLLTAELKANAKPAARSKRSKTLVWDGDSDCFDDLRYSNGGVYMTFTDGSQYFEPMDKSDAREWFSR